MSYPDDLETSLSLLESPFADLEMPESLGSEEVWAKVTLDMLDNIRADVRAYLPEFHVAAISVECFLKAPMLPDVASPNKMCSRLVAQDFC